MEELNSIIEQLKYAGNDGIRGLQQAHFKGVLICSACSS